MMAGYNWHYPYPPYPYYYPNSNANYTGYSAPPVYATNPPHTYVTLPPIKATLDIPSLQVPMTSHYGLPGQAPNHSYGYWDPSRPYTGQIPPSPETEETEEPEEPNAQSVSPQAYTYTYDLPEDQSQRKPPMLPRKGFTTRKRRSLRSYGVDMPFDSLNLAPRPVHWRPDYVPPHSARAKLRRFSMRNKLGGDYSPWTAGSHKNYKLHSLIHYTSSSTYPISYDLRRDPQTIDIQYLNLPRHSNDIDWYQVATTPPMHELHLYHRKLPWTITVRATQTNGITIGDIFDQIHENISMRITRQEFYNIALKPSDREEMTTAFYYRGGLQTGNGMLRVDFLGFDVVFLGLVKGKNGLLEIKTGPATPP